MSIAQEAQEKQPKLLEPIGWSYYMRGRPLYLTSLDLLRCSCARGHHILHYDFANKPLRVYDYAIIKRPVEKGKWHFIVIAFFWQGEHHRAIMGYDEEAHQLLESFKEKFRRRFGVLLTPYWQETPKGVRFILKPAV